MSVAYISRLERDESHILYVDAPGYEALLKPGDVRPANEVYCRYALESRIPALLPDAACHPLTRDLQITHAIPVGAFLSVPILSREGEVIGLLCCLDPVANPSLTARDLGTARMFADIAGAQLEQKRALARKAALTEKKVARVIERRQFSMVYQPLWNIGSGKIFGFECLARFSADPARDPKSWFEEAGSVGMLADLELALIQFALAGIDAYLTPTTATPAIPLTEVDQDETPATFTRVVNLLDRCALSIPNGMTAGGLPTSLQIMCSAYDEATAMRIGWAFEQVSDWVNRVPAAYAA